MKFRKAALVAAVTTLALSAPQSSAWHVGPVVPPVIKPHGGVGAAGGGSAGASIVGGFIAGVAVAIIIHEIKRTRCDMHHFVWVDTRPDGYANYKPWRDPCATRRVAIQTKLWPEGK